MKKQLSNNLRIATLVMGITLSGTVNAQNLLCVILDGDQTNDAIAILQVSKLGIARGALCYLDLTSTTTLENCHAVTGTMTGVQEIKIGLQGFDLLPSTQISPMDVGTKDVLTTSTGAFVYTPTETNKGTGSVATYPSIATGAFTYVPNEANPDTGVVMASRVQGTATAVKCKATKALSRIEPRYTIETQPSSSQRDGTSKIFTCPSDVADTFTVTSTNPEVVTGAGEGGAPVVATK